MSFLKFRNEFAAILLLLPNKFKFVILISIANVVNDVIFKLKIYVLTTFAILILLFFKL